MSRKLYSLILRLRKANYEIRKCTCPLMSEHSDGRRANIRKMESNLEAKLEALLFLYGEPMKIKKLAEILETGEEEIRRGLETLRGQSNEPESSGLSLIIFDDKVQLTTKPDLKPILDKIIQEELDSSLTPASLEALSIIAYLGPCSRTLVDYIRGVNSSFILRSLLIRGLIERKPDPKRANAFLYHITFDFLRHIGIDSPDNLPNYEKYQELAQSFLDGSAGEDPSTLQRVQGRPEQGRGATHSTGAQGGEQGRTTDSHSSLSLRAHPSESKTKQTDSPIG